MKDRELLESIHTCLIGDKLAGHKGLIDKVDCLDDKSCKMQNQLDTLMQDREKNKNKISISIPKWLTAILGVYVKTKTGV